MAEWRGCGQRTEAPVSDDGLHNTRPKRPSVAISISAPGNKGVVIATILAPLVVIGAIEWATTTNPRTASNPPPSGTRTTLRATSDYSWWRAIVVVGHPILRPKFHAPLRPRRGDQCGGTQRARCRKTRGRCEVRRRSVYRKARYSSSRRENYYNPFPIGGSPEGLSGPLMTGGPAGAGSAFGIRFAILGGAGIPGPLPRNMPTDPRPIP
jgi:hypothetical protein